MDNFEIPVTWKHNDYRFPAAFMPMGYTYKIKVTVHDIDILFEPDEEKSFRAIVSEENRDKAGGIDRDLLSVIAETLHELLT